MKSPIIILNDLQKTRELNWQNLLEDIIEAFDCSTGTIHTLSKETNLLELKAHRGIPDFLLPKMAQIPIGKGMAGIAAERRQPVEMCNLQNDTSGIARPSAKETKVEGSIAVPMLLEKELFGVLGIAKPIPYDFLDEEKDLLLKIGKEICSILNKGN
ncbi:MAG TPA: GAF domain-containing protein [Anditalea sp.]|nr:GAF domain-containing protein [Anditalea sp.]